MTELQELEYLASPGKWGQYHPKYMEAAVGAGYTTWDTSHDMSAVTDTGGRYKVAKFRRAADAAFADSLVNAYRGGQLIEIGELSETFGFEDSAGMTKEDLFITAKRLKGLDLVLADASNRHG